MNNILKLISDGDGSPSTMRVAVLIILLAVIIPKVYISIRTSNPIVFDQNDWQMIATVLGAKAAQSYFENKPTPPKTP